MQSLEKLKIIRGVVREGFAFPSIFLPFFLVSLLSSVLTSDLIVSSFGSSFGLILSLAVLLFLTPLSAGLIISLDRQIRFGEGGPNLKEMLEVIRPYYWLLVGTNLLTWLAVFIGVILLIVPGLFLMVKLVFVNQEILLGEKREVESILRGSWDLTAGYWLEIFNLLLLLILPLMAVEALSLNLSPAWIATIRLVVGTAVQTWLIMAATRAYEKIKTEKEED